MLHSWKKTFVTKLHTVYYCLSTIQKKREEVRTPKIPMQRIFIKPFWASFISHSIYLYYFHKNQNQLLKFKGGFLIFPPAMATIIHNIYIFMNYRGSGFVSEFTSQHFSLDWHCAPCHSLCAHVGPHQLPGAAHLHASFQSSTVLPLLQ